MDDFELAGALSAAATALANLRVFFASELKDGGAFGDRQLREIDDALKAITAVSAALEKESRVASDADNAVRLRNVARDLSELAGRLEPLRIPVTFLAAPVADVAQERAFRLGMRSGVESAFALGQSDLLLTERRLRALMEYYESGRLLYDTESGATTHLEEVLAHFDAVRPEDMLHMGGSDEEGRSGWARVARTPDPAPPAPLACRLLPVMFATNRHKVPDCQMLHADYADGRSADDTLSYGVAEVAIPRGRRHKKGRLERPSLWKLQFREDPEKHIVIVRSEDKDLATWTAVAQDRMAEVGNRAALVFIHGFRVSFADAVRRAGQIGWDLEFPGLICAFSWASEGRVAGYGADVSNARLAIDLFLAFLKSLRNAGVDTIHVIAHSMGNVLLIESLRKMKKRDHLHQVVLAAPDYDADEFRKALGELQGKAKRYTLYGSEHDLALATSKRLRSDHPRAGDGGAHLLVVDGVDTIDASAVGSDLLGLGHSYFSSDRSVLADVSYVIRESLPPERRYGLDPQERRGLKYWVFVP